DLYRQLRQEGRLIYDRWWLDPDFRYGHATFHPHGMSAEDLTAGCLGARVRFNTWSSLCRRARGPRTNLRAPCRLGVYLLSNLISKREIFSKQDRQLGSSAPLVALPREAPA